jgi:hypothetical protein
MPASTTTIPVDPEVKDRLAQAKGDQSWNAFLSRIADELLDDAIRLAEERLKTLRTRKAKTFSLDDVRKERATRQKKK